jgi:hypothetical protein
VLTYCPDAKAAVCVWDTDTGGRRATVPLPGTDVFVRGWWDEDHLIILDRREDPNRYVVTDFRGKTVRALAEISEKDQQRAALRFSPAVSGDDGGHGSPPMG